MGDEAGVPGPGTPAGRDEKRRRWSRVLLKLSGEALQGGLGSGIDPAVVSRVAAEIAAAASRGVEVAVVVGGGNFFRGVRAAEVGLDRPTADEVGMLATVMNGLALRAALERQGAEARLVSALPVGAVAEPFDRRRAVRHLARRRVVVLAAGTGSPFFTTDSAAALRALEIGAQALLKGTQVDGVYTADPRRDPGAQRLPELTHREVLARGLEVMDLAAVSLAMGQGLPVVVFHVGPPGNVTRALLGEPVGSVIRSPAPAAGGPAAPRLR